ncbi:MAG TPA: PEGA domain-containing protein [Myxococcales bacterium]|jgi:TolB-like protein
MRFPKSLASSLVAVAACLPAGAWAQASRPQLAVLDFEARKVDPLLAQSITEAAAGALRELRVFKVVSQAEIRQMLAVEREKALLTSTCDDTNCIGQIGNAIGARYVVVGSVDAAAGAMTLRVRLFDMKKAEVQSDEMRPNLANSKAALEAAPSVALAAVRPILDKEQGFLDLLCREIGASVKIDGRLVGVTPFPMQKLGWGPHRVVVEKEGFIAWAKDVQVERNQAVAETVALIPSPEFIDSYRSRNNGYRAGAWVTTVLAIAGVGAALGVQYAVVEPTYEKFSPLQKAFGSSQNDITDACKTAGQTGDSQSCYDYAERLGRDGDMAQWIARGAGGLAIVSAGLAAYFWLAGDDPGKYDTYRSMGEQTKPASDQPVPAQPPKVTFGPIPGGAMGTLSFQF